MIFKWFPNELIYWTIIDLANRLHNRNSKQWLLKEIYVIWLLQIYASRMDTHGPALHFWGV